MTHKGCQGNLGSKRWFWFKHKGFGGEAVRERASPLVMTGLSIVLVPISAWCQRKCRWHHHEATIIAARDDGTQFMKMK